MSFDALSTPTATPTPTNPPARLAVTSTTLVSSLGRDENVVVGLDRHAGARVGVGVRFEDRHGDGAGDADGASAGRSDDRDELLLGGRQDDDVAGGLHIAEELSMYASVFSSRIRTAAPTPTPAPPETASEATTPSSK